MEMGNWEDKNKYALGLIENCILPELLVDLGTHQITPSHFENFRNFLDRESIKLFDFLQTHDTYLYIKDRDTLEFRYKLILLFCEQTSTNSQFVSQNNKISETYFSLTEKHFLKILENDVEVTQQLLHFYIEHLNRSCWKKNMGAVFGFSRFCELYYAKGEKMMDIKASNFTLSVGLLLEEFYDPEYKLIGCRLFNIILYGTSKKDIVDNNIHKVIYNAATRFLTKFTGPEDMKNVWDAIYSCVCLYNIREFGKWSVIDDTIERIIRQITLESNVENLILLFSNIWKFILMSNRNHKIDQKMLDDNYVNFSEKLDILREQCLELHSHAGYRWLKKFLQLLVCQSNWMFGNDPNRIKVMQAMHICYLICILPLKIEVSETYLENFFSKFPATLLEALRYSKTFKEAPTMTKAVRDFFETFLFHIKENKTFAEGKKIMRFQEAVGKIFGEQIFKINSR